MKAKYRYGKFKNDYGSFYTIEKLYWIFWREVRMEYNEEDVIDWIKFDKANPWKWKYL